MTAPRRYALRLLSPFLGTLQILQAGDGRALSEDGLTWHLQVRAQVRRSPWGRFDPGGLAWRYVLVGTWTAAGGLRRVPLDPTWVVPPLVEGAEALARALARHAGEVPYPLEDALECWLLDAAGDPLALLASAFDTGEPPPAPAPEWRPCRSDDLGFVSPSLLAAGVPADGAGNHRYHRDHLADRVRKRAGQPPRCAWFRRRPDGGGEPLAGGGPDAGAGGFPELLLREDWDDPQDHALVQDYLAWLAPRLLTLPGLAPETRARLERLARRDAVAVAALHRLYPELCDPGLLKAARVEAALRAAEAP